MLVGKGTKYFTRGLFISGRGLNKRSGGTEYFKIYCPGDRFRGDQFFRERSTGE